MPQCGACYDVILDENGEEIPLSSIPHFYICCKTPVHSDLHEGCSVYMIDEGQYFCSKDCLASADITHNTYSYDDTLPAFAAPETAPEAAPGATQEAFTAAPPGSDERAPAAALLPNLQELIFPGARISMSFMTNKDDVESGNSTFESGVAIVGFDDGDLQFLPESELQGLLELCKLSAADDLPAGLCASQHTRLQTTCLSHMKHKDKLYPVGVFLEDLTCARRLCGNPIYDSLIVSSDALEMALEAGIKGSLTTRGKKKVFSVGTWSSWRTVKYAPGEGDQQQEFKTASAVVVQEMDANWERSEVQSSSLDQLRKQPELGPATLHKVREERRRAADRARKAAAALKKKNETSRKEKEQEARRGATESPAAEAAVGSRRPIRDSQPARAAAARQSNNNKRSVIIDDDSTSEDLLCDAQELRGSDVVERARKRCRQANASTEASPSVTQQVLDELREIEAVRFELERRMRELQRNS
ncbi:MAG: hypothetical protein SGPRY_007098 [Prymnesium sp.]